jgi:hypothetical protein
MPKNFEDKSNTTELTEKYLLLNLDPFKTEKIISGNFKPHPFMIGERHVANAAKNFGGMLTTEAIKNIPCASRGCGLMAHEHTFDVVLVLKLTRNVTNSECSEVLKSLAQKMQEDGLDGLVLMETPEKFRISK